MSFFCHLIGRFYFGKFLIAVAIKKRAIRSARHLLLSLMRFCAYNLIYLYQLFLFYSPSNTFSHYELFHEIMVQC